MDLGLPDFRQYTELLDALRQAPHAVVILTGDVHFGRVAVCQFLNGQEIVEVIASPLAARGIVPEQRVEGGAGAVPGRCRTGVNPAADHHREGLSFNGNHFATIGFSRSGGRVRMRVQAWPTENKGRPPVPVRTYERWIS